MKASGAFLSSCLLISIVSLSLFSGVSYGWQPALELPVWIDLGLRFTGTPYPGQGTTLIGEIYTLVGDGGKATVTFELPEGFSILSGKKSRTIKLSKGFRKRIVLKVRSDKPCGKSFVKMSVVADFPVSAMKEQIRMSTQDREIQGKRIALASSLKGKRTVSFVKRLYVSKNEVSILDKNVLWTQMAVALPTNGSFFMRDYYEKENVADVRSRLKRFEHYERLLRSKGNVDSFLSGSYKEKRLKKIAQYGEDLHSMAIYYYRKLPGDTKRIRKLIDKTKSYDAISNETLVALKNLLALVHIQTNEVSKAVKVWAKLSEEPFTGTLSGYMLYNAGEALNSMKKKEESVEFFRAALLERPGLLLARERLRDAFSN